MILRPDTNNIDVTFLYFFLTSPVGFNSIVSVSSGSVQTNIAKRSIIENTEIFLPTLAEQRAIAGVLSSLDDKIDLLHRQNKTLEGMAEAFWRKMFVEEADPGWERTTLGRVAKFNEKSIDRGYPYAEIEYLDTGSIVEGTISDFQCLPLKDAPSRAKRIVRRNDVVISMVRPIQKHYGILKKVNRNTVVSTGFVVITCVDIDPHFAYLLLTQNDMTEYLDIVAEGSTSAYPSLVPSDLEKIEFQMPPVDLMSVFSEFAGHTWDKIEENHSQIRTLSRLRDVLLPKLISGEVRVKV